MKAKEKPTKSIADAVCFAKFDYRNRYWSQTRGLYVLPIFDGGNKKKIFKKITFFAFCSMKKPIAGTPKIFRAKFKKEVSREDLAKMGYSVSENSVAGTHFLFKIEPFDCGNVEKFLQEDLVGTPQIVCLRDFCSAKKFQEIEQSFEEKSAGTLDEIKKCVPYLAPKSPILCLNEVYQMDFGDIFGSENDSESQVLQEDSQKDFVKQNGQIFTPDFLVESMLDYVGYTCGNVISKHIIDNSCGNGAFLREIVERYCSDFLEHGGNAKKLQEELETFIHGIEIDKVAYVECLKNLDKTAEKFGIKNVNWNVIRGSALAISEFDGKMDFVVGNPPYVRVHNLEENYDSVKSFHFAQDGMTDLYLVFYELGLRMLRGNGKLCYITPSSWLSSLAATNMRNYILRERNLSELVDLGHFQAFENATTYTMIAIFDKSKIFREINYYSFPSAETGRQFVDCFSYEEMSVGDSFYVASRKDLKMLREIKSTRTRNFAQVKNGFATLADNVFIKNVSFQTLTIPILKASTGKWHRGFFPYDRNGKPLNRDEIFSHLEIAEYLEKNKKNLLKKQSEKQNPTWFLYGRSQALKDVYCEKYSMNTIIRDLDSIKLMNVPAGSGIYSGLYILTSAKFETLEEIIKSDDFLCYLKILKNYKSGGYYTFSSKDLEQFINYKISKYENSENLVPDEEFGLFEGAF